MKNREHVIKQIAAYLIDVAASDHKHSVVYEVTTNIVDMLQDMVEIKVEETLEDIAEHLGQQDKTDFSIVELVELLREWKA